MSISQELIVTQILNHAAKMQFITHSRIFQAPKTLLVILQLLKGDP